MSSHKLVHTSFLSDTEGGTTFFPKSDQMSMISGHAMCNFIAKRHHLRTSLYSNSTAAAVPTMEGRDMTLCNFISKSSTNYVLPEKPISGVESAFRRGWDADAVGGQK